MTGLRRAAKPPAATPGRSLKGWRGFKHPKEYIFITAAKPP